MVSSEIHADASKDLLAIEVEKAKELRELITPAIKGKPELESFCTDACLRRFLRARRLDVKKAEIKLQKTLEWRTTYKPHEIRFDEIREESRSGKTFILDGTDREGRTVVVMRPRCQNTSDTDLQIRFLVYCLEQASRKADREGVEKMTWLIDYEGYSRQNAPPLSVTKQTLSILQGHYPERLGLAVCYHAPWLFGMVWKVISPLVDPVTYEKVHFIEAGPKGDAAMASFFNMDLIEESMGGKAPPAFDFARYERQQLDEEQLRQSAAAQ